MTDTPRGAQNVAQKKTLRREMKRRLKVVGAATRARAAEAAAKAVAELSGPVALYASMPAEFPTDAIDAALRRRGVVRAFPRFDSGTLRFHRCPADVAVDALPLDSMGIGTPDDAWPVLPPAQLRCVLTPGLALDAQGRRLGRGAGYYDAFIKAARRENPALRFWGLFYDFQFVDEVPTESHDERLDAFVTPALGRVQVTAA